MTKEKDFSLPMFTEAYEQFGQKLEEGEIMVVEGVASNRDGETRMTVHSALPVDGALISLVEEVTWLLDSESDETLPFLEEMFTLGDKGLGNTLIRLGFAKKKEEDGLVAELDSRFTMRMSSKLFREWRSKAPVLGARVKIKPPDPPKERIFEKR